MTVPKNKKFEKQEDKQNQRFENIQIPFQPAIVVTVTLLRFRNVSVSGFSDLVDTPDPEFEVTCPSIKESHLRSFKTRSIKDNVTSGEINETFKFVIENDDDSDEVIQITLRDKDVWPLQDDEIGVVTINCSKLKLGKQTFRTFTFGKQNGNLDVILQKETKKSPDFRFSFGLCPEEINFRKKRIPIVCKTLQSILGKDKGPRNETETPIVSLVGSGGGYRAVTAMCGAMEALNDAGLMDVFTYSCGLSGSAWYLSAAYALEGMSSENQRNFHDGIRERFDHSLLANIVTSSISYAGEVVKFMDKYNLPRSFVNFFPGYMVGKQLLGDDKLDLKLSDLSSYVETGKVPYPLLVALHVKNKVSARRFHAYVERSPHEIYLPSYGIGLKPSDEGSVWNGGFLSQSAPEYPLHFTVGMTGCAFSILLNQYFKQKDEDGKPLFQLTTFDKLRRSCKKKNNQPQNGCHPVVDGIESDDEDSDDSEYDSDSDNDCDDELASICARTVKRLPSVEAAARSAFRVASSPAVPETNDLPLIAKLIRGTEFYKTRTAVIGRTAKLHNFVHNCDKLKRFSLNPFGAEDFQNLDNEKQVLIEKVGHKCDHNNAFISSKTKRLSFVDAGIFKNVPTDTALRPQRGTDLMIVMDFNNYNSDEVFNYKPLLAAAAHSWQSGMKFPKVDLEEIKRGTPKEFLILPGDEDGCPTVLWFTLCNKSFKQLNNYQQKSTERRPSSKERKFNDFPVFGPETNYSTFRFNYEKYHFDQLRELMYHNVSSHIEEIKEALVDVVRRKQQRLGQ